MVSLERLLTLNNQLNQLEHSMEKDLKKRSKSSKKSKSKDLDYRRLKLILIYNKFVEINFLLLMKVKVFETKFERSKNLLVIDFSLKIYILPLF